MGKVHAMNFDLIFKTGNIDLLNQFNAKARCTYTQPMAHRLWSRLKERLSSKDRFELLIAWDHFMLGESARELDGLCKEIRERWER